MGIKSEIFVILVILIMAFEIKKIEGIDLPIFYFFHNRWFSIEIWRNIDIF
jgi:hypothetical protein